MTAGVSIIIGGTAWAYVAATGSGGGSATSGSEVRQLQIDATITGDLLADAGADVVVTVTNPTDSTLKWNPTEDDLVPRVTISGAAGACNPAKWTLEWDSQPATPIVVGPHDANVLGTGNLGVDSRYNAAGCRGAEIHLNW